MISQQNISSKTPMGANLVPGGGATFRAWAPLAKAVYLNGTFGGIKTTGAINSMLLAKDSNGYWAGFMSTAQEGDPYCFFVDGNGSTGPKRDPYARELATDAAFPTCSCLIRSTSFPWHDAAFVTPDFSNMIVYQIHVGTYHITTPGKRSTFLDVVARIPYMAALGINVLQPLPVDETETDPSMGYDGADYFSPDFPYIVTKPAELNQQLATVNGLLAAKGLGPMSLADISSGPAQLKTLVDLCHVYGIAVVFDVVYNHAGGFNPASGVFDDQCIYYWDRARNVGNNNDSLYFTDQDRGTGGLSFALWKNDVRQFLINNALYYIQEFHADGFRYDEISSLLSMNKDSGWSFCNDLTNTLRAEKQRLLQNAEYWPGEFGDYPKSGPSIVQSVPSGGAGFDVLQHDGLRYAVRRAIAAASGGQNAGVNMDAIAQNLYPSGYPHAWQAVTCVENHDIVKSGREPRIPALADGSNRRSWYATSRSRFASGMLLTAPGIPQIFMGQECLEDKPWDTGTNPSNLIFWAGLETGSDRAMVNHHRFNQELIGLRWDRPALRGDNVNPFHVHNLNRVIAFHRWLESTGDDVVVVGTLSENTWWSYQIGFPSPGRWREIFNSDVYENWVNPMTGGNGGGIDASGPPLHGFPASANIVIPANGFVVFARL